MPESLLAGALPQLFGTIDRTKKNIAQLFANPGDYMAQANATMGERLQALDADISAGFGKGDPAAQERAVQALMTVQPANMGATVWHGSPHIFDKFDSSKIGAGEGAQSYGHGLYFAESPAVAKSYQEKLSPGSGTSPADIAARWLGRSGGDPDVARAGVRDAMQRASEAGEDVSSLRAAYGQLFDHEKLTGALYKVDLPDEHISKMVDIDQPVGRQTEFVKSALQKLFGDIPPEKLNGVYLDKVGPDLASKLQGVGVPGLRYLDQLSRTQGNGTSNFVVFPGQENLLSILERNGKPVQR